MSPEPLLVSCARRYLQGEVELAELVDCAEKTGASIEQHRQEVRGRLGAEAPVVQQMVQAERLSWEESAADFLQWSSLAARGQHLEKVCEALPIVVQRLQFDIFRLEEAIWSSRGPTTLAAINRVLAELAHGQDLDGRCQLEAEALRQQAMGLLELYPEPLREPLAGSLESLLEWLDALPEDDEALDRWAAQGEALGKAFAAHDLQFLERGYGGGPTAYPPLNLALNACWLQEQGLVAPGLSVYCLQQALEQLARLPPPPEGDLPEVHEDLREMLEQLSKLCQRCADTAALRAAATEVAQELEASLREPSSEEAGAPCPVCGQLQPLGVTRCGACGSRMLAGGDEAAPADRLETMLAYAHELLSSQSNEVPALLRQGLSAYQDDLKKARQHQDPVYQQILGDFSLGLDGLQEFLESPDRVLLEEVSERLRSAQTRLKDWREKALAE